MLFFSPGYVPVKCRNDAEEWHLFSVELRLMGPCFILWMTGQWIWSNGGMVTDRAKFNFKDKSFFFFLLLPFFQFFSSPSSSPPPPPPPSMVRQPMSFPGLFSSSPPDISFLYRSPPPPYIQQHQEYLLVLLSHLSRGLPARLLPWSFIFSTFIGILELPIQAIWPAYCNIWTYYVSM